MRLIVLFLMTSMLVACGDSSTQSIADDTPVLGGVPIDQSATLTRVQNEIFTPTCALIGCHDNIGRQSQMVLTPDRSFLEIVNVPSVEMPSLPRIQPADTIHSYLYRKVTGAGITGDRMPQSLPPLTDAQINLIRNWIRRGAPND